MNVNFHPYQINYYIIFFMRNLILLLTIILLSVGTVFAADSNEKRNAYKSMTLSNKKFNDMCNSAARNFRYDNRFANYLRNRCMLYESDRQRYMSVIFPITNSGEDWYKDQYPILQSRFAIQMNSRETENYKLIVNEYCKYNKYKFTKKDPQVCSSQRINAIFVN